jgi:hypothetical protein
MATSSSPAVVAPAARATALDVAGACVWRIAKMLKKLAIRQAHANPELHEQFRRNPLFAPGAIRCGHLRDQWLIREAA